MAKKTSSTTTSKSKKPRLPAGVSTLPDGRYRVRASVTRQGRAREAEETLPPGATLGQAVDARAALTARLRGEVEEEERPPLFPTYALQWLERRRRTLAPETLRRLATFLELHARPALGSLRLDQIERRHLIRWRDQLSHARICRPGHPLDGREYSRASLHAIWRETLRVLRDGWAEWELRDPSTRIEPPGCAVIPPRMEAPTWAQVRALLADLEGRPYHLPALLMASAGLRQGEVRALLWADLDLDEGVAHLRPEACKSRYGRRVPLPAPVVEALRARRLELVRTQHPLLHAGLVFGDDAGRAWGGSTLTLALRRAAQRAGLARIRPHDLRRAFVTHAVEAGVNALTLREVVGHRSEQLTRLYYRPQDEARRAVVERVWDLGLGSGARVGD